jgi:drug/metabolite transporter (DMT)-like permease
LAFLFSVPITFAITGGDPDFTLSPEAWAAMLALGILGTGLAYVLYLWLVDNVGAVRASLVTYIIPVVAVFLGWLVLDESVGWNTIAGGLLIIAGVASVLRGQAPARQQAAGAAVPAD